MANELLTRDDIIRGKKNFDAQNAYMTGTAEEQVTLPDGKKIKTLAGLEKEFLSKTVGTGASYPVNSGIGSLALMGDFGIGNTGWGAAYSERFISGKISDIGISCIRSISTSNIDDISDYPQGIGNDGSIVITRYFNQSYRHQILITNTSGIAFMRVVESTGVSPWSRIYQSGDDVVYKKTTAISANTVVTSTGELQRSTSSKIFKKDIADISIPDYRAALKAVRPVSYRSTDATSDRTDWSWYSFIAEEIAAVDPRLAQMDSVEFFEDTREDGTTFINSRELPEGEYAANGINTNGIVALMVHINQQMLIDIEALEKEKTQLKTRMTKFENRLDALEGPAA